MDVTEPALGFPLLPSLRFVMVLNKVAKGAWPSPARTRRVGRPRRSRMVAALAALGRQRQFSPMEPGNLLVLVAIVAVGVVLVLGLFNMMRGGSPSRSQQLMRWRVLLQFAAVVVIMGVVWWRVA
jgi:hypothetical protein